MVSFIGRVCPLIEVPLYSLVFFSPTDRISVLRIHSCWQSSSSLFGLHDITLNIIPSCHAVSHFHRCNVIQSCYGHAGLPVD